MNHIAIMIPGIDRLGGAERQAIALAKGLRRRGWCVTMIALTGTGGSAVADLHDHGVAFLSLEMRKGIVDPRGWIRFNRWLWNERPDVLHAHLPHAAWFSRWSRLAAPVPVVVDTLHSSSVGPPARRFGYALSKRLTDHVSAVSQAVADTHLAASLVLPDRFSILTNGLEVEAWQPDARTRLIQRNQLGWSNDFVWIAVGRLEAVKDYPTMLAALARSPQSARLLILGAGSLESELALLTADLGIEQRVRFLGFEPDVWRWMQLADAFLHSSLYEGLPMVLLEAGASQLPVVATDVSGTREVIVNGENGWLARAGDPQALADVMRQMMQLPLEERHAMGLRAWQRIARQFSMDAVLDSWEQLYENLLYDDLLRWKGHPWRARLAARDNLNRQRAASV